MADCGTLTVRAEFSRDRVFITQCGSLPSSANPGDSASLNVTISNENPKAAAATVQVRTQSGEVLGSSDRLEIAGADLEPVTVDFTVPSSAGDYTIETEVTGVTEAGAARGLSVGTGRNRT